MPNILCPKNKKNFSDNFLLSFGLQKRKEKQSLYLQSFDFNDKTLLILFEAKFPMAKKKKQRTLAFGKKNNAFRQSCFFLKMRKAKNKQTRSEVFFLFVKTTILLCKTIKHFFVSQLSKINKPLV